MTEKKDTQDDLKVWEKPYRENNLKESNTAFEMFIIYKDMGVKRSLKELADRYDMTYHKLRDWSYKYRWSDRINEANKYKIQQDKKINAEIKQEEINRINQRLDIKSKLVNKILQVLIKNADKYENTKLDFKEFANFVNLVSKIDNMMLADLNSINELEKIFNDAGVDTSSINNLINNYNLVLASNNKDAIDNFNKELDDVEY